MARSAAGACMWSGVDTVTASMRLPSFSSITRKSLKRFACGYFRKEPAALTSSTSHNAQMFSLSTFSMSLAPLPPTPIPAMFNRLFAPRTFRVATNGKDNALTATAVCLTNCRRVRGWDFIMGVTIRCRHLFSNRAAGQGFTKEILKHSRCDTDQFTSHVLLHEEADERSLVLAGNVDVARCLQCQWCRAAGCRACEPGRDECRRNPVRIRERTDPGRFARQRCAARVGHARHRLFDQHAESGAGRNTGIEAGRAYHRCR